jgi:hypothetical protein
MPSFANQTKVLRRLLAQSWLPCAIAVGYAVWDYYSTSGETRTASGFVKSWGIAFFLLMWFAGQWFRASKQIADAEQLTSIQADVARSLRMLGDLAESAAGETPGLIPAPPQEDGTRAGAPIEDAVRRVLDEVPKSPKGALLILGAELERELRELLWTSGWIQGVGKVTVSRSVEHLEKLGVVPANLGNSVRAFLDIRNRLLHGYGVSDDEVLRAIDIGLTILRTVLAIPREEHRVYHPGVEVYADEVGRQVRDGIRAVVLQTKSPGGASSSLRAYPTTRTHFKRDARVSWEWNPALVVDKSWYKHPDTGAITPGWVQSMEFIGRNIEDV